MLRAVAAGDLPYPPVAALLEVELSEVDRGGVELFAHVGESDSGLDGRVSTSVIAAILHYAADAAALTCAEAGGRSPAGSLSIDLLRGFEASSGPIRCRAGVREPATLPLRVESSAVAVRTDATVGHAVASYALL